MLDGGFSWHTQLFAVGLCFVLFRCEEYFVWLGFCTIRLSERTSR
jgi:hypothetical protein